LEISIPAQPHLPHCAGWRRGFFVLVGPDDQLHQRRGEVDAPFGQAVELAPTVAIVAALVDDAGFFESPQPIGEHVCGDAFTTFEKVTEGLCPLEGQVAERRGNGEPT
jgi:hypothetical protein